MSEKSRLAAVVVCMFALASVVAMRFGLPHQFTDNLTMVYLSCSAGPFMIELAAFQNDALRLPIMHRVFCIGAGVCALGIVAAAFLDPSDFIPK